MDCSAALADTLIAMPSVSLSSLGLALGLFASIAATPARGTVIYATGFEAPDFSLGELPGQDGWLTTASIYSSQGVNVSTARAASGTQSVEIDSTYFPAGDWFWKPLNYQVTPANQIIQISVDMYLASTALNSGGWGIDCYDDTGARVGQFYVDPHGLAYISDGPNSQPAALAGRDAWTHFVFTLDYGQRLMTLGVNGNAPIGSLALNSAADSTLADADFRLFQAGTDTAYFDNLSIVAVPGTGVGSVGVGAAILLGARRRR